MLCFGVHDYLVISLPEVRDTEVRSSSRYAHDQPLSHVLLFVKVRLPTRLLCPWDFPGKKTGVGCRFLLQALGVHAIKKKIGVSALKVFLILTSSSTQFL